MDQQAADVSPFTEEEGNYNADEMQSLEAENRIFEEIERAVMMEREKIVQQADQRMALIERNARDSILRGRGYSLRLNLNGIND